VELRKPVWLLQRDRCSARAGHSACALYDSFPTVVHGVDGEEAVAPHTIRRRAIQRSVEATPTPPFDWSDVIRPEERSARLANPATSGAAPATGGGACLNKTGRLKSSGVHSLTGLHPQHGIQREERETRWYEAECAVRGGEAALSQTGPRSIK